MTARRSTSRGRSPQDGAVAISVDEALAALHGLTGGARVRWLARRHGAWTPALIVRLADEVTAHTQVDLGQAESWLVAVRWLAAHTTDTTARARASRAAGHVASLRGRYRVALAHYRDALAGFRKARLSLETAITRSGALQTLIYLGRYREAFRWATLARRVFATRGDDLRLARLETNVGNILHRHDRFEEALARYQSALEAFVRGHHPRDEAIVLRNMAVCYIGLNRFEPAIATYERARACAQAEGLHGLVPRVDYNIAYLHYLRGDYELALRLYDEARARCEVAPDPYHAALCDLDQAELTLELNLVEEGAALARSAHERFAALGLKYELAKSIVNMGIAAQRVGNSGAAVKHYRSAYRLFVREGNRVWLALLDLYIAFARVEAGDARGAARLARSAVSTFARTPFDDRSALACYVMARVYAMRGQLARGRASCERALTHLRHHPVPALAYRVWHLLGRLEERAGRDREAARALGHAHLQVEALRGQLGSESLKIAFLQDKLAVYESLVRVTLAGRSPKLDRAFRFMEQAKSRTLVEHLSTRASEGSSPQATEAQALRDTLAARYRQRDAIHPDARRRAGSRARSISLEREIQLTERRLQRLRARDASTPDSIAPLGSVQEALPGRTILIEYYVADEHLIGWVITRRHASVHALGPVAPIVSGIRFLQFQLAAPRWREPQAARSRTSAVAHLRELHERLLSPFATHLASADHVVVVPHGPLHAVPFAALHDGTAYLGERITCSIAPSATAFVQAMRQTPAKVSGSLILGVPDPRAPLIEAEVRRVAARLTGALVLEGAAATRQRFAGAAGGARVLHLATHGHFRADNPAYSSIQLVDGPVTLQDLQHLHLDADLVTLSGCGTGRSVVVGGDELFGLSRGLLRAGARSLVVSLWDVHDASTTELVDEFYLSLQKGLNRSESLQAASAAVRRRHPHPYFWAPFALIGDHRSLAPPIFLARGRDPF
jgi:tetratricopeptide (TPR) repeat protein